MNKSMSAKLLRNIAGITVLALLAPAFVSMEHAYVTANAVAAVAIGLVGLVLPGTAIARSQWLPIKIAAVVFAFYALLWCLVAPASDFVSLPHSWWQAVISGEPVTPSLVRIFLAAAVVSVMFASVHWLLHVTLFRAKTGSLLAFVTTCLVGCPLAVVSAYKLSIWDRNNDPITSAMLAGTLFFLSAFYVNFVVTVIREEMT